MTLLDKLRSYNAEEMAAYIVSLKVEIANKALEPFGMKIPEYEINRALELATAQLKAEIKE